MKNTISKMATLVVLVLLLSCEKENQTDLNEFNSLTPELIGKIHNKSMTNFKENYIKPELNSSSEIVDDIIKYNIEFLKIELDKNNIEVQTEFDIIKQRELFDTDHLAQKNFYNKSSKSFGKANEINFEDLNLYDKINFIYENSIINSYEKDILIQLINYHQMNYEKLISDSELKEKVLLLEAGYLKSNPNFNNYGSFYVASSIEISKHSNEWWEENYDDLQRKTSIYSKTMIAPWLAADIIGGAASGLINIFEQGAGSGFSRPVDAGGVGWAMLKGAVTSSVAPWSRIAKLFK